MWIPALLAFRGAAFFYRLGGLGLLKTHLGRSGVRSGRAEDWPGGRGMRLSPRPVFPDHPERRSRTLSVLPGKQV